VRSWNKAVLLATLILALALYGTPPGRAVAALSTVGGACGFQLGAPFETGALGTFGFEVPVYPANPLQVCQTAATATALLQPAGGGHFTNVANNPLVSPVVLHFNGGPLPLGILWTWSPHCADPPAAGNLSFEVAGQTVFSSAQPPQTCFSDLGGSSHLSLNLIDPQNENVVVGLAATNTGSGYWTVTASGASIQARGSATTSGFLPPLSSPVVGIVANPAGEGYWVAAADGGIFAFGGAPFHGSLGGVHLTAPIVGMAATPDGGGYWLVGADGGVFAFGNAAFFGSLGGVHPTAPIVGMAATATGTGYWLAGADGGVFAFGGAGFHGSLGGVHLAAPVVDIAAAPDGGGYWMGGYDGGVFNFGSASFHGSAGSAPLQAPVVAIAATPTGTGYWLAGADGGIFNYGDATFFGATPLEP
jgi:hypothetical protein